MIRNRILKALLLLFPILETAAQFQLKGGEISITKNGLFYDAKVYLLVDWPATATKSFVNIDWGDGSGIEQLPYAGSECTYLNASSLLYTGTHTFPSNGEFTVTVLDSFFIPGIVNIPNSETQKIKLKQIVTTKYTPIYNSPVEVGASGCLNWGNTCNATTGTLGPSYFDTNSDSLAYEISGHSEISGYVIPPVVSNTSGAISFSAQVAPGFYNVCLRINEWRHLTPTGPPTLMGSNFRDLIVRILDCTSIPDIHNGSSIRLYPNPTTSVLILESESDLNKECYEILNSIGEVVLKGNLSNQKTEIELDSLSSGVFYFVIKSNSETKFFKFVKH